MVAKIRQAYLLLLLCNKIDLEKWQSWWFWRAGDVLSAKGALLKPVFPFDNKFIVGVVCVHKKTSGRK